MSITTGRDFGIAACKHMGLETGRLKVMGVDLVSSIDEALQLHVRVAVNESDLDAIASYMGEEPQDKEKASNAQPRPTT